MSQYDSMCYQKFVNHDNANKGLFFAVVFFFTIAIGLRPLSWVFVDMMNYLEDYTVKEGDAYVFLTDTENLLFDNIFNWFASKRIPIYYFFLFIASVYFGCAALACRKLFPHDALLAFVMFLAAFSTFSYGTNGRTRRCLFFFYGFL